MLQFKYLALELNPPISWFSFLTASLTCKQDPFLIAWCPCQLMRMVWQFHILQVACLDPGQAPCGCIFTEKLTTHFCNLTLAHLQLRCKTIPAGDIVYKLLLMFTNWQMLWSDEKLFKCNQIKEMFEDSHLSFSDVIKGTFVCPISKVLLCSFAQDLDETK